MENRCISMTKYAVADCIASCSNVTYMRVTESNAYIELRNTSAPTSSHCNPMNVFLFRHHSGKWYRIKEDNSSWLK